MSAEISPLFSAVKNDEPYTPMPPNRNMNEHMKKALLVSANSSVS